MDNETYLAPPWIKYPYAPAESDFWKDGSGAEYLIKYNKYVKENGDIEHVFPRAITFTEEIEASDSLSENFKKYLKSDKRPYFIKLWAADAKPKYNPEYVKGKYSIMYDIIFTEEKHIPIGKTHYHSFNEIVSLVKESIKDMNLNADETEQLWDEMKYTVYLNALYYKLANDINFINEMIKMDGKIIACYSDNLEYGLQEKSDGSLVGNNLMGIATMELRDHLIDVYKNYSKVDWTISGKPNSVKRCTCSVHTH